MGDSSGRGWEIANPEVIGRLTGDIQQYANALGLQLTQEQLNSVVNSVFPEAQRFKEGGVYYASDREGVYQKAREFILPNLQRLQFNQQKNPAVNDQARNTVSQIFQSTLGRTPTSNELDHFSKEFSSGEVSGYDLEQFLAQTPEYLKAQSEKENQRVQQESAAARQSLDAELLKSEEETFKRALPQIMSQYMRAGRIGSSGVDAMLAKERARLAQERQGFLANAAYGDSIRAQGYRREDFVGANAQAFNQYLRQSEPAYQSRMAGVQAQNALTYQTPYNILGRQREVDDYNRQRNDYMAYLNSQKSSPLQGALRGALSGAGAGASFGPYGALAGIGLGAFGGYSASR